MNVWRLIGSMGNYQCYWCRCVRSQAGDITGWLVALEIDNKQNSKNLGRSI